MPQIDQLAATYQSQIFWLLVFFGITFFAIGRGMVPRVMDTVAQRDTQIAADLAAAGDARAQADAEEEAWRVRENENRAAAQALVGDAKAQAAAKSEKTVAAAQKRLDTKLAKAEAEIEEARKAALVEVEGVAVEATQDIVARLAGLEITRPIAKSAVKQAMTGGARG